MKYLYLLLLVCVSTFAQAQVPANYYNSANGLTGYALKAELNNIVTSGHNPISYNQLWTAYQTTWTDDVYENDGSVLDFYTEDPTGNDPHSYTFVQDQCGNATAQGDCYNREHLFPSGFFNAQGPAYTDQHQVWPSDGFINNARGNFPFGETDNPQNTYDNGTKRGPNSTLGYTGTVVEPIDAFKGDVARAFLYFATRYDDAWMQSNWDPVTDANNPLNGTVDQYYEQWFIDILLAWHAADPVSQAEIDRNDEIYNSQGNANPYVNNPQYVTQIWTATSLLQIKADYTATFIDNDTNGVANAGDSVEYVAVFENVGNQDAMITNVTTSLFGSQVYNLSVPGNSVSAPVTIGTKVLNATDIMNMSVSDQATVTYTDAMGANTATTLSDDPSDSTDSDSDTDGCPDDVTVLNLSTSNGANTATQLFISEYQEGSGSNKLIEIANFTGADVDLSNYSLRRELNGGGSFGAELNLSGTLADGAVYVIANQNGSYPSPPDLATSADVVNFNGNDPVALRFNGVDLDVVGVSGGGNFAKDIGLIRKPAINSPTTTYDANEWLTTAQDDFSDVGQHNITFAVDDDLLAQIVMYPNPTQGQVIIDGLVGPATVQVIDLTGRVVLERQLKDDSFYIENTGIYLVRITQNESRKTMKLVVR